MSREVQQLAALRVVVDAVDDVLISFSSAKTKIIEVNELIDSDSDSTAELPTPARGIELPSSSSEDYGSSSPAFLTEDGYDELSNETITLEIAKGLDNLLHEYKLLDKGLRQLDSVIDTDDIGSLGDEVSSSAKYSSELISNFTYGGYDEYGLVFWNDDFTESDYQYTDAEDSFYDADDDDDFTESDYQYTDAEDSFHDADDDDDAYFKEDEVEWPNERQYTPPPAGGSLVQASAMTKSAVELLQSLLLSLFHTDERPARLIDVTTDAQLRTVIKNTSKLLAKVAHAIEATIAILEAMFDEIRDDAAGFDRDPFAL